MTKFSSLTPNLAVDNIRDTVHFYTNTLGFTLKMAITAEGQMHFSLQEGSEYMWANMENGGADIMFQTAKSFQDEFPFIDANRVHASGTFYIQVEGIDALFAACSGKVNITSPLETKFYGMREFYIKDNDGYDLCFGEPDPNFKPA